MDSEHTPTTEPAVTPVVEQKKKSILVPILIAAGALLVAGLIALGVWFMMFRVTPEDYKQASADFETLQESYDKVYAFLDKMPNLRTTTLDEMRDGSDAFKKDFADYKQQREDFAKLRALYNGEVKEKYDTFIKNTEDFTVFAEGFVETLPTLEVFDKCSVEEDSEELDPRNYVETFDKNNRCRMDIAKKMSESKNSALAEYGKGNLAVSNEQRAALKEMQDAYIANDDEAYDKASERLSNTLELIMENSKIPSVKERVASLDATDAFEDFAKLLKAKTSA